MTTVREFAINKKQFEDHLASFLVAASIVDDNEDIKGIDFVDEGNRIGLKVKIRKEVEGKSITINGKKETKT